MLKKIFLIALVTVFSITVQTTYAQGIGVNETGASPDPSAGLDVDFDDRGLLGPRLTTAQRNSINSPAQGLQIFNIDTDCIEVYFSSGGWLPVRCGCPSFAAATFASPASVGVGLIATFSADSISSSLDYIWSFQNGTPSTSSNTFENVTWSQAGTYEVSLTVTEENGCSATETINVLVDATVSGLYSFNNCGQTGRLGPTQTQCNTEYSGTTLGGNVTVNSGVQTWVVPTSANYRITVVGAKGGDANSSNQGGLGVSMRGDFSFNAGDQLDIIVGHRGQNTGYAGGGGASAVSLNNNPLIVAGGGGGGNSVTNQNSGYDAVTGQNGVASNWPGGTGGNGANGGQAQGGAGFFSDGLTAGSGSSAPQSLQNGGAGGDGYSTYWGGFGGGGSGFGGGGGGGGYSGGSAGSYSCCTSVEAPGGGGGSFNNGTNQVNIAGFNSGHGYVIIEQL